MIKKIKEDIKRTGLQQKEFAQLMDVSHVYFNKLLNGVYPLTSTRKKQIELIIKNNKK